jgi:hypothetical protein
MLTVIVRGIHSPSIPSQRTKQADVSAHSDVLTKTCVRRLNQCLSLAQEEFP